MAHHEKVRPGKDWLAHVLEASRDYPFIHLGTRGSDGSNGEARALCHVPGSAWGPVCTGVFSP